MGSHDLPGGSASVNPKTQSQTITTTKNTKFTKRVRRFFARHEGIPTCRGQKAMDVSALQLELLAYLAARPGRLLTRHELFRDLWPGVAATDNALTQLVSEVRGVLDDSPSAPRYQADGMKRVRPRGAPSRCSRNSGRTTFGSAIRRGATSARCFLHWTGCEWLRARLARNRRGAACATDRKCGLRNRFPASRPHQSGRLRASVGA